MSRICNVFLKEKRNDEHIGTKLGDEVMLTQNVIQKLLERDLNVSAVPVPNGHIKPIPISLEVLKDVYQRQ